MRLAARDSEGAACPGDAAGGVNDDGGVAADRPLSRAEPGVHVGARAVGSNWPPAAVVAAVDVVGGGGADGRKSDGVYTWGLAGDWGSSGARESSRRRGAMASPY